MIGRWLAVTLSVCCGAAIGLTVGYIVVLGGSATDLAMISFHDWVTQASFSLVPFWAVMGATVMVGTFILWFD